MGMTFDGCIGDVEMDGKPIGLFNFRQLVQSQNCRGCVAVYVEVSVFHFADIIISPPGTLVPGGLMFCC